MEDQTITTMDMTQGVSVGSNVLQERSHRLPSDIIHRQPFYKHLLQQHSTGSPHDDSGLQ